MKIKIDTHKMECCGDCLLDEARTLRYCRCVIEEAVINLAALSGLEECRAQARAQELALEDLTADLTLLSASLQNIAAVYGGAERRNDRELEGERQVFEKRGSIRITDIKDVLGPLQALIVRSAVI